MQTSHRSLAGELASLCLASILSLSLMTACTSTRAQKHPDDFRSLQYGYHTGLKSPAAFVVRTQEGWDKVWKDHNCSMIPAPLQPEVDFQREMVLCVALGQRPTGGYGLRIRSVRKDKERWRVEAVESKPAPDAICPTVLTQPYEFAIVDRFDGEVVFDVK